MAAYQGGGGFKRQGGGYRGGAKSFGGPRSFDRAGGEGRSTMHSATCSQCHKACEVPFKPDGSRAIYCRDCFTPKRESSFQDRGDRAPRREDRPAPRAEYVRPAPVQPSIDMRPIADAAREMNSLAMELRSLIAQLSETMKATHVPEKIAAAAPAKTTAKKAPAKKKLASDVVNSYPKRDSLTVGMNN